jgi:hypothetical protein
MLNLFWPKSSAMCRNLRGYSLRVLPQDLNPLFPLAWNDSSRCILLGNVSAEGLG